MKNTFFVSEFNRRRRDVLWKKNEDSFKKNFRLKLNVLKMIDLQDEFQIPEYFYEGEFYRLSLGYRGIGKNNGFASGIQSKASIGLLANQVVRDHLIGATEVGRHIHEVFKDSNYDINWMVDEWLYEHLFLWATVKLTKDEHRKENVLRNSNHTIEEKLNLEHYKNVSDLI